MIKNNSNQEKTIDIKSIKPCFNSANLKQIRPKDIIIRFIFGVIVSALAGIISSHFGPKIGGSFLSYPAILPASLTLIQAKDSKIESRKQAWGAIFGGVGLVGFSSIGSYLITSLNPLLVLSTLLLIWIIISVGLYFIVLGIYKLISKKLQ